ncbi:glycosyl transferase family 1 [Fervidobacterium sp. 2310opik-2]|nr:glycosyl transferase family 1 [Fervidobacterium sp. 2310opik-2]
MLKKVLIVGYYHPKNDKRVFRTVEALSKVCNVSYQYISDNENDIHVKNNIKFIPILFRINAQDNVLKKALKRIKFDLKVLKVIESEDYDILYMHHFLPMFPLKPFKSAKSKKKMVVYDIHEYHPENFLNSLSGLAKFLKEKIMWKIFEMQLKLADKLIFVSKEMQEDVYEKLGLDKPYLVVPNYASISVEPKEKRKEISFVGKVTRNIEKEKEILKKLIEKEFTFKIIGMDSDVFKEVPHEYTSFLPYEDMMIELSKSAFSLISYNTVRNENYKNDLFALPNKYYDSICAGTPVIVKNTFVSMAKEVEKYGIGVVIDPNDVEESVKRILNAYERYDEIMENVRKYKGNFVWDDKKKEEFVNFVLY